MPLSPTTFAPTRSWQASPPGRFAAASAVSRWRRWSESRGGTGRSSTYWNACRSCAASGSRRSSRSTDPAERRATADRDSRSGVGRLAGGGCARTTDVGRSRVRLQTPCEPREQRAPVEVSLLVHARLVVGDEQLLLCALPERPAAMPVGGLVGAAITPHDERTQAERGDLCRDAVLAGLETVGVHLATSRRQL